MSSSAKERSATGPWASGPAPAPPVWSSGCWRAVFLVNVPLAGAAMIAALLLIGRDPPADRARSFDLSGAVTVTGAVTLIVLALVQGPAFGWLSPLTLGVLLAGILVALLFVLIEARSADPLLPFALLHNPWLMLGVVTAFLFMATFGALLYFLSIFFQEVLLYDALATGLAFLIPTAVVVLSSTLAGRAVTRFGLAPTMVAALAAGAVGALAIGFVLSPDMPFAALVPGLVIVSIGDGVIFTTIFIAAATGVPDEKQGVASGIVSTAAGIGAALGLAALVLITNRGTADLAGEPLRHVMAAGITDAAYTIAGGVMLMLAIVLAFQIGRRKAARLS